MELSTKPGYRSDVDGLRAVAVLSVLAFHYGAPIRGGFSGVDVFFVISGFLITQILSAEINAGTFTVIGFYDRRMRRILPALLTMLAVVLLAGKFLLTPGDYMSLAKSAAAAGFGVSNFFFLANTGYFDQAADVMPLLHTWSLAVEEQFYVVWPLLLLALAGLHSRLPMVFAIGVIVVVGCVGSIVFFQYDQKSAFYMALPRAWELAIGALLVFLPALPRLAGEIAGVVGLILIGIGFSISPEKFPGQFALYPCLGAALVIWPRLSPTIIGRILGWLAPVGLISYSLYLWHWPVWVYFRIYINNGHPTSGEAIALTVVSVILAIVSFRFVERPFRRPRWTALRTVLTGLASILAIFCAAMYVDSANGLPQRLPPEGQAMRSLEVMWEWPCAEQPVEGITGEHCVYGAPWQTARRKTLIWGDSHAQHFAPILDAINADPDRSFLVLAGCPAVLGDELFIDIPDAARYSDRCRRFHTNGVKILKADALIDQVILPSNWVELPWRIHGHSPDGLPAMAGAFRKLIKETSAPGRRFLLVGIVPRLPLEIVECAIRDSSRLLRRPCVSAVQASTAHSVKQASAATDEMLRDVARSLPSVEALIPADKMCRNDSCTVYLDGEFLYRDAGHIRRNLRLQTKRDFADMIGLTAALAGSDRDARLLPDLTRSESR